METMIERIWIFVGDYAPSVVGAILTLIIGFWIIGRINRILKALLDKKEIDLTIRPFLLSVVNVVLKVLLLLAVAKEFGVETTSFVAIFSTLALAIGLALQGNLGHFASGILILVFKPYKVGDLVKIGGGELGRVKEVQVFHTVLVTLDNKHIIIPNGVITSNTMTNISGQGTIGVELTFGIGYGDDIDKAREIILQVGKACPFILDTPKQSVAVKELGDSSVNLFTRPFCKSEHYWDTYFYMQEHVKKAFDKAGVSIPFPQMDIHNIK